jgi:hypothetical protein
MQTTRANEIRKTLLKNAGSHQGQLKKIRSAGKTEIDMSDDKTPMITRLFEDRQASSNDAKKRLQLKYLPHDFDFNRIDEYEPYLLMCDGQKKAFIEGMSIDEFEFWVSLETARALYQYPLNRRDGSITEEKFARHPERFR